MSRSLNPQAKILLAAAVLAAGSGSAYMLRKASLPEMLQGEHLATITANLPQPETPPVTEIAFTPFQTAEVQTKYAQAYTPTPLQAVAESPFPQSTEASFQGEKTSKYESFAIPLENSPALPLPKNEETVTLFRPVLPHPLEENLPEPPRPDAKFEAPPIRPDNLEILPRPAIKPLPTVGSVEMAPIRTMPDPLPPLPVLVPIKPYIPSELAAVEMAPIRPLPPVN